LGTNRSVVGSVKLPCAAALPFVARRPKGRRKEIGNGYVTNICAGRPRDLLLIGEEPSNELLNDITLGAWQSEFSWIIFIVASRRAILLPDDHAILASDKNVAVTNRVWGEGEGLNKCR